MSHRSCQTWTAILLLAFSPWIAPVSAQSSEDLKNRAAGALALGQLLKPGLARLIRSAAVQSDLHLSPQQRQQVAGLEARAKSAALSKEAPDKDRKTNSLKTVREYQREADRLLAEEILTPAQYRRLQEISLQLDVRNQGLVMIFSRKEILAQFSFSDEQKDQLQRLRKEFDQVLIKVQRGKDPLAVKPELNAFLAKSNPQLLAILTDLQQEQWKKLIGPPFDFSQAPDLPLRR